MILEEGQDYDVSVTLTFTGAFKGYVEREGKRFAAFGTDRSAGIPTPNSAMRYVLAEDIDAGEAEVTARGN